MVDYAESVIASFAVSIVPIERRYATVTHRLAYIPEIIETERLICRRRATHGTKLAEIDGNASADVHVIKPVEHPYIRVFIRPGNDIHSGMPPFLILCRACKIPRVIAMHSNHQPVLHHIFRQDEVLNCQVGICHIARHTYITGLVHASCCADCIDTHLIPLVEDAVLRTAVRTISATSPSSILNLVKGFKNEEIPVVGKTLSYLKPHHRELLFDTPVCFFALHSTGQVYPVVTFARRVGRAKSIMVNVNNRFESCLMSHIHQFRHPVQPCFLNRISRSGSDMPHPCHRNTNRFEARVSHTVEGLLGGCFVAPSLFVRTTAIVSVHLVTKVPPNAHRHSKLNGIIIHRALFFLLRLTGGTTNHKGS